MFNNKIIFFFYYITYRYPPVGGITFCAGALFSFLSDCLVGLPRRKEARAVQKPREFTRSGSSFGAYGPASVLLALW